MRIFQTMSSVLGHGSMVFAAFFAGIVGGGSAAYVLLEGRSSVAAAPTNPLLTANRAAMRRLVPSFFVPCGDIVFEDAKAAPAAKESCVDDIKTSVWQQEQVRLTEADILDPRVKARWLEVVKSKP